jgi:hypothetical protein
MPKTSNRRYDHHKKKTKKRNGVKKNKTGKNRGKIQVGGGWFSKTYDICPFCTRFLFDDKYAKMKRTCSRMRSRALPEGDVTCNANVLAIKNTYVENHKQIYDSKASIINNKCINCGLAVKVFEEAITAEKKRLDKQALAEQKTNEKDVDWIKDSFITKTLTIEKENYGIPKFEDIKTNLKNAAGGGSKKAKTKTKTEAPSTQKAPGKQKASGDGGEAGPAAADESVSAQEELETKQEELEAKQGEIDALNATADQKQADHDATIEGLNAEHAIEKQEIKDQHQIELDNTIDSQNLDHSQEIDKIKEENRREITKLKRECNEYEKEAKSVIKIGDNISFKIVDEDGVFIEGAFKVLENLKTKIENAIVEAKSRRDSKKEEAEVKPKPTEEVSVRSLLGGTGAAEPEVATLPEAPQPAEEAATEPEPVAVSPLPEAEEAAPLPEQEPAATEEAATGGIQKLSPEAAAELKSDDEDDDDV